MGGSKKSRLREERKENKTESSAAESVESAALSLEGVDDVHGSDGLSLGVLGVSDGVTDDVLQEGLEDSAGLLVDEARDALDSSTAGETADGRFGDALDVVAQDLPVALGASLSESLASFAAARHAASPVLRSFFAVREREN